MGGAFQLFGGMLLSKNVGLDLFTLCLDSF